MGRLCGLVVRVPGYRTRGSSPALPDFLRSTIEELLGRESSGSGLENREYGLGIRRADHVTLYPQILALTSPTCGGRSIGIVRFRTKATEILLRLM
jgi:hypothetical protein